MGVINPVFVVDAYESAITEAMAELRSVGRAVPIVRSVDVELATRLDPRRITESPLSPRQTEVLALIADEGLNASQIGLRLGISGVSVRTHLDKIFRKLKVNSRPEAVAVAIRHGILGGGA